MQSLADALTSGDFEEVALRSIGGEATNPAATHSLDHGLHGLINSFPGWRLSRLSGETCGKYHLPGRSGLPRLCYQRRKIRQIARSLVDTHLRRQGPAFTATKPFGLFGCGIVRQFGDGKDKQQTLRLGLGGGCGQQLPEMIVAVHEAQARGENRARPRRPAAVALTGVASPIDSWQSGQGAQSLWSNGQACFLALRRPTTR